MTITKYLATCGFSPCIKTIELSRESDSSVWIGRRREDKFTEYQSYFDTYKDAKLHLINSKNREIEAARRRLERFEQTLTEILDMQDEPVSNQVTQT